MYLEGFCMSKRDKDGRGKMGWPGLIWNMLVLAASAAVITVSSLSLAIGMFDISFFFGYFRRPILFLLNYIPVFLFLTVLYCVFNRQWLAYLVASAFVLGASAGNFYKLKFRSEPFTFADVALMKEAFGMAGNFDMTPNTRLLFALAAVIMGTAAVALIARRKINGKSRVIAIAAAVALSVCLWNTIYSSDEFYRKTRASGSEITHWEQQDYISKGFVYPFLYSIADSGEKEPGGSTLDGIRDIRLAEDRKADIAVFQLEAYSDLRRLGVPGIDEDVYSVYDNIKEESLYGNILVDVFAGGTIDTEHRVLTGEKSYRTVKSESASFARWFSLQGYHTTGNHPNLGSFYNRRNVDRYLGFDEYFFSEELYETMINGLEPSSWFSDCVLFTQVSEQMERLRENGKPVFSFNVTMQGHSPYEDDRLVFGEEYFHNTECSKETYFILNNYFGSVADTQKYMAEFLERGRNTDKPLIVVFYGDHKPWLGDGDSVASELGIDLDAETDDGVSVRYSTEYLIWMNSAAKDLCPGFVPGKGKTISAAELIPQIIALMR